MNAQTYCSKNKEFMISERERIKTLFDRRFRSQRPLSEMISKDFNPNIPKVTIKDAHTSKNFRSEARKIFKQESHTLEDHLDIWANCSKCIASAPNDSLELAKGYYKRASFFFHIKNYEESLKDCIRGLLLNECNEKLKSKFKKLQEKNTVAREELKKIQPEQPNILFPPPEVEILNKNERIPCASDAISVGFSEECGRMIVAARDINPGEVLIKEKFYYQIPTDNEISMHCFNCCKLVYSSIPCETCAYAMFCSEACKKQAWNDYHKIECILMNEFCIKDHNILLIIFSLRILLKIALKVVSIEDLKTQIENLDNCADPREIGFSEGVFESDKWSSILTLSIKSSTRSTDNLNRVSLCSAACLYYLGSETDMFDKRLKTSDDFLENEDALFIGCLLSRIHHITTENRFSIHEEKSLEGRRFRDFMDDLTTIALQTNEHRTKVIATGVSAISSLFNHGCIQDAAMYVTENMDRLHIAVRPIKKGSQICHCYSIGINAFLFPKAKRLQEFHKFDFICKCEACEENWPTFLESPELGHFIKGIYRPRGDYEELLNAKLIDIKKYIENHKFCHKEIYRVYGIIIDFYRARFNPWCKVPKCT